jgi:hypothetical protein
VQGFIAGCALPPPVLERASFAYAQTLASSTKDPHQAREAALKAARNGLEGNSFQKSRGDADEEHFRIVFRDREPLGNELARFEESARALWGPLLAVATESNPGEEPS